MNKIVLETGLKTIEIDFKDRGVTAEISFNPSDPDLAVRFDEFKDRVTEKIDGLKDIELDENGNAKDMSFVKPLKEATQVIYDELDRAFGNEISDKVFQFCNPLACIEGKYFVIQFVEAIAPVIRQNIQAESKKLEKYLGKYQK